MSNRRTAPADETVETDATAKTWWRRPVEEALRHFAVDSAQGLSRKEAARRRRRHGPNALAQRRQRTALQILADQFKSLVVLLLVVAAIVAAMVGQMLEAASIVAVLLINAAIGFTTELRAVRSMAALRKLGQAQARVRRDGRIRDLPADGLVPGDIVLIAEGDVVPADLRLLWNENLRVDESALTGESVPVDKTDAVLDVAEPPLAERANMAYRGTAATRGQAEGVVVAIGSATEAGRIAELVSEAGDDTTPLEQRLTRLGQQLVYLVVVVAAAIVISGLLAGRGLAVMVETGIALAVAAVPEGLPIVATVALARGMWLMARRKALVKRLSAVETLGATTVVLTDKTGTLTENRMVVERYVLPDGEVAVAEGSGFGRGEAASDTQRDALLRRALEIGALCNNAALTDETQTERGDPMEVALLQAAAEAGCPRREMLAEFPEVGEASFSRETRMMATFHERTGGSYRVAIKGAPDAVLAACARRLDGDGGTVALDDAAREAWNDRAEELAADGLRVLALAEHDAGSTEIDPYRDATFAGLVGLADPPRPEVADAIADCRSAGVRVVMVTGDQPATAGAIARAVRLTGEREPRVYEGDDPEEHEEEARAADVFARVDPDTKLKLVRAWQDAGHVVGMTGDGVNDAPALEQADIGIAMGRRGTEVAKEAGDIVLKDDAFGTIVAAIAQGRAIFRNIRRFIVFLLSGNLGEILAVGGAALTAAPLPLLPLQILFINLLLDVFPALALGVGAGSPSLMRRPPRRRSEPVVARRHWLAITAYGVLIAASVLGVFAIALYGLRMPEAQAVTVGFMAFGFARLGHVFNMRDPDAPLFRNDIVANRYVWAALALCAGLLAAAVYLPGLNTVLQTVDPGLVGWGLILGASLVPLLVGQAGLALRARFGGREAAQLAD